VSDEPGPRPDDQAWREAYRTLMDGGSPACPADERLAALAVGELEAAERLALADHVARCRRCGPAYAVLRDLDREAARQRRPRPRWTLPLAAAATLLVAAAVATQVRGPRAPAGDDVRGPGAGEVRPSPGAVLPAPPDELAWPPGPEGSTYRVRVHAADGDVLWTSAPLPEPRADLAAPVLDRLAPGHAYFWTVEVHGGAVPERRGPYWFQVAAPR
jgi:hypothetical protein